MTRIVTTVLLLLGGPALAQTTADPFPTPIESSEGVIRVGFREFTVLPVIDTVAARMMLLVDEPYTRRLFVNDMRGPLYSVSYDGRTVTRYLDIDDARWGVRVESGGRERGFQSFAFHPDFGRRGARGFGRFHTWTDVSDTTRAADFAPAGAGRTHDTVLLEWTARNPTAATYDGGAPRELLRLQQPFRNHNAGLIAFRPQARPRDGDYGLLYIGSADGGSAGDPQGLAQNPGSAFGKILRIDPLGRNSANGQYGIPADNPFVARAQNGALGEIYASGVRNPQRFGWDAATGALYVADIGQNTVEEISPVPAGANLGWNLWEGSFRFARGGVDTTAARSDSTMTFPIAEYDHSDPILQNRAAVTGIVVYRETHIPQLRGRILFGDMPSGEIFHVSADRPPAGGHTAIRRVLLIHDGEPKTLLQLIQEKNRQQGRQPAPRADLRFGTGTDGQIFLLNKADGVVRLLVPSQQPSQRQPPR